MKWQSLAESLICWVFCGSNKNVIYKIVYHQKLLVLKEGVYMGVVLLGETLKDTLACCSCVLNSALAGLAKNIVGAQITLKYPVGYFRNTLWGILLENVDELHL